MLLKQLTYAAYFSQHVVMEQFWHIISAATCEQREKTMGSGWGVEGYSNYLITKNIICQKEQQNLIGLLC